MRVALIAFPVHVISIFLVLGSLDAAQIPVPLWLSALVAGASAGMIYWAVPKLLMGRPNSNGISKRNSDAL